MLQKSSSLIPAPIPEELIATFEMLWQTAMEHAGQRMADIKESLDQQEQSLKEEKIATDKVADDLKLQLAKLQERIEAKISESQALQTKLTLADERYAKQIAEINKLEQQYELRLKHLLYEKHQAIEQVDQLQAEAKKLQFFLSDQSEKHQSVLAKERELQEESEKRWMQLIDQARSEANNWCKKYDGTTRKQNDKIESLQNNLMKLQDKFTSLQCAVIHKEDTINSLNKQVEQLQAKHTGSVSELAVLKANLKAEERKKYYKKSAVVSQISS